MVKQKKVKGHILDYVNLINLLKTLKDVKGIELGLNVLSEMDSFISRLPTNKTKTPTNLYFCYKTQSFKSFSNANWSKIELKKTKVVRTININLDKQGYKTTLTSKSKYNLRDAFKKDN